MSEPVSGLSVAIVADVAFGFAGNQPLKLEGRSVDGPGRFMEVGVFVKDLFDEEAVVSYTG